MHSVPRCRAAAVKIAGLVVILLLSLQYFVNMVVYRSDSKFLTFISNAVERGNGSTYFLRNMMTQTTATPLEPCPLIPTTLKGKVTPSIHIPAWAYVEEENQMLAPGGRYKPEGCIARHRVAIIIPYRDREVHLKILLQNLHPFLRSQQLDYGIFVVELAPDVHFNRAALMNIGYLEASKLYDYQCFIFHDVDLLPEDDRNLYGCPSMPRHMSVAIDKLKYKLPYPQIFGGVSAISKDHFVKINGFSNLYFGWGGEDDDMYKRILYSNLTVIRYSTAVARYKMLSHVKDKGNPQRFSMLRSTRARRLFDGINSLKYTRLKLEFRPLYTWIYVTLNETEIRNNKDVKQRIDLVNSILAQKAKAAQNRKKQQEAKNAPKQKPVKANPDKVSQPSPAPSVGGQTSAQIKSAPSQSAAKTKQAQIPTVAKAKPTPVQNQKPVLANATNNGKDLTQVEKPVLSPFDKAPKFISWVPTNASVPVHLNIDERLAMKKKQKAPPNKVYKIKEIQ